MVIIYLLFLSSAISASDVKVRLNSAEDNNNIFSIGVCNFYLASFRDCPHSNVSFFLYTSTNRANPQQIIVNKDTNNLLETSFSNSLDTKILIHGYNSDMFLGVLTNIKDEYFKSKNLNIIFVDWRDYAKGPCYPAAVWNCKPVGNCVAQLTDAIRNISDKEIHLIGFSLGSHVAGFVSNFMRSKKIERITGLDPALPGFVGVPNKNKLDSSDADFVDVIHTNAFMQGTPLQSGHIDFYVNGGVLQPGCLQEGNILACSHHRAPVYFGESINNDIGFWGWSCSSYWQYLLGRCWMTENRTLMGEHTNQSMRGIFMVITNAQPEYAVGPYNQPLANYIKLNNNKLLNIANALLNSDEKQKKPNC